MEADLSKQQTTATQPPTADKPRKGASVPRVDGGSTSADGVNLDETQAKLAEASSKKKKEPKEKPFCACGCGNKLNNPNRIFLQGHDAKCKKALRQVAMGEESPRTIQRITVENRSRMQFLNTDPELARAMAEAAKAHNIK